jgi:hypothetical protein
MIEVGYRHPEYSGRNNGSYTASMIDMWCSGAERLIAFENTYHDASIRVRDEDLVADPQAAGQVVDFTVPMPEC